jgi:uncharacterized membrane-anchored protein YhcB (DUF1043 family)
MAEPETYELVPVTPIRRLEKEVEKLKKERVSEGSSEMNKQVIDILKMNQKIVDDMAHMQGELIAQLYKTNEKLSKLTDSIAELVVVLSSAAEEEVQEKGAEEGPSQEEVEEEEAPAHQEPSRAETEDVDDKLERIIEQNTALINSLNVLGKELSKIEEKGE